MFIIFALPKYRRCSNVMYFGGEFCYIVSNFYRIQAWKHSVSIALSRFTNKHRLLQ